MDAGSDENLHRAPGDGDRAPLRERIRTAVAEGRISSVDGDIRLNNLASAQSLTELSLIARDLDQLDAAQATTERPTAPPPSETQYATPVTAGRESSGRLVPLLILGMVVSLVVAGAVAVFLFSSGSGKDEIGDQPPVAADRETPAAPEEPGTGAPGSEPEPATTPFELSAAGIEGFIALYRERFSTTKVTDLTFYPDYVIVRVPVPGKKRDAGWLYRDGRWSDFGGVRAVFPGTVPVDITRLEIPALMRNIAKARRSLNVEEGKVSHVGIDYRPQFDEAPNVNIYVSNQYSESGYLATDLDGKVERSYPFS